MNNLFYKKIVLTSLLENDPNKDLFYKKMAPNLTSKDARYVYGAPINPLYLENIDPKHSVVLTNEVYETLEVIEDYNFRNKKEVPFILYGKETRGGAILFNDIDCDFRKLKDDNATFENIYEYCYLKIRRFSIDKERNKVICIGHTHPFSGNKVALNYSLTDFMSHVKFCEYPIFKDSEYNNKIFSLMKSVTEDYNFVYYNPNNNRFYKVPKVYLQRKKKEFIPLSAYNYCDD